jgi:urease accessory protein
MILIWQLIDSAFPAGGFVHSAGLEAAWQSGEVTTEDTLRQFVHDSLWQVARSTLPLVAATHRAPDRFEELDALCDAFLTNAVANRASRALGRGFLTACARAWPSDDLVALDARARGRCGHYAPIVGAVLKTLGVPLHVAQRIVLFTTCRSVLAAAVRLGIVGPYRAQRLQFDCAGNLDGMIESCARLEVEQIALTSPLVDLLQSAHDRMYSRLFQS